ncbi:MAG: glycosyltransferase [Bacteroidales bacterium]|nr:glycosyltransferase [Bacteroidales bacterium]
MNKSTERTKICFIIASLVQSGPVNVLFNIIKYSDYSCFDIYLVTLFKESKHTRLQDFEKLPISLITHNYSKKNIYGLLKAVPKTIKTIKPDVIHSFCIGSMLILSFLRAKTLKMHTINVDPKEQYPKKYGFIYGNLLSYLSLKLYSRMDCLVCCAEHLKHSLPAVLYSKITVIVNGIDENVYSIPTFEKKNELKKRFNVENKVVFLSNNRLSKEKNIKVVFDNFPESKYIHLFIVGEGSEFRSLKVKENITHISYEKNIASLLQLADYYISASKVEGMPLAVLEAISCGLVPILSDIAPHREITQTLSSFYIFNLGKKETLQEIIQSVSKLEIEHNMKENRVAIENVFSSLRMSKEYLALYKRLLS